jgi:arylsulfatase A-like enzyme
MRISTTLFLVALAALAPCTRAAETPQARPNVLFIAVDDLNDWVNCLGGRKNVHTPNIDRLAKRGVLFTNAHCSAPSCNPSRVSIMTGVSPSTSGVYHNGQNWRSSPALAEAVTIPDHFRANGYTAYGGGKIFHSLSWIIDRYGKQQNEATLWDDYFPEATKPLPPSLWPDAANAKTAPNGYVNWSRLAKGNGVGKPLAHYFDWGAINKPDNGMADYKVVDWAATELAKSHRKPFFHAVGIYRPHIPWFVPQKYFDLYPPDKVFLPPIKAGDLDDVASSHKKWLRRGWHQWVVDNDEWKAAVRGYLASISFADAQVGRLLAALDASPHAANAIIVLWSDHGMHIGEKEHWEKFTLWEESTRVPLIIVAPGVGKAGTRCSQPVSLLDVFPTLNELCGVPQHSQLEGQSLVPLLRQPGAHRARPAVTTWGQNNHAIRDQRYRYIRMGNGEFELYDHQTDPDEFTNIATRPEAAAVIDRLKVFLPTVNASKTQ